MLYLIINWTHFKDNVENMWILLFIVILSIIVGLGSSCEGFFSLDSFIETIITDSTCIPEDRNDSYDCSNALPRTIRSITKYAFQMLKESTGSDNNGSIGAPICTWFLMAFLSQYSTGNTRKQLLKFVDLENIDEVRCISKLILSYFKNDPVDVFGLYSFNILADNKFQFPDYFVLDLIANVGGRAHNCNFSDPMATAMKINKMISDGTLHNVNNTVSEKLAPKIFNDQAKLASVSGLFFMAKLEKPLNKENVTLGDFYLSRDKKIRIIYGYQRAIHKYKRSCKLDAQIIQLDFKEKSYQFVIILPNKICGLKKVIQKIANNPQLLQDEMSNSKEELIQLYHPILNNESAVVDAMTVLKNTGEVDSIFDLKTTQLADSCGRIINQTITSITQKIRADFILFDDKSYEELPENLRNKKPVNVVANHPSIYIIMKNSIPLLCSTGKVMT